MVFSKFHIHWCWLLFLLAGCSAGGEDGRVIKIGIDHGPGHSFTTAMQRFGESFERETGGRYRVKIYDSARLGNERTMQEMLTIGTLEMTVTGIVNTYEPLFAVFELPYLYRGRLEPGMGLIGNNVLHDRSAFDDAEGHERHLYRARYFERLAGTGFSQ